MGSRVDVERLRELLSAVTGRPWHVSRQTRVWSEIEDTEGNAVAMDVAHRDAALIVAAVNAMPELLDRLERYEEALLGIANDPRRPCPWDPQRESELAVCNVSGTQCTRCRALSALGRY